MVAVAQEIFKMFHPPVCTAKRGGLYCDSNPVHVHCLRFCYMDLIRDELHRFARL